MESKISLLAIALLLPSWLSCGSLKRFAYEGFGRDKWQHPEQVIQVLAIRPGEQVADVGAGGGYFTFRLADAVGQNGRVYAVDVDEQMTDYLKDRAAKEGYRNVDVILSRPDDPQLPPGEIDLIFTSDTYHHIQGPTAYFAHAKRYLRPDGQLAIIDHNGKGWFAGLFGHYTPADTIRRDVEAAGYRLEHEYDFLPQQNFLVFTPQTQ